MYAFILDWLNLLFRWAHLIVGIGWIGTSFYFIALDLSLRKREKMNPGVYGTAWEVHGGGFYHVEKYLVAPGQLPDDLIWYKWEAYLTWVTGFCLIIVQYYANARAYLISPNVLAMAPAEAILISLMSLFGGWLVYDRLLCRTWIGRDPTRLAIAVFALIIAAAYLYTHVFSPRGAFIHIGAFIGTLMAFNVFRVIMPNQTKAVAQLVAGEPVDPVYGQTAKQRSVHNNYLTLPVLVMMVSNHYSMVIGHPHGWLVAAMIIVMGASIRHFLNRHEAGDPLNKIAWTLPLAAFALVVLVAMTMPRTSPEGTTVMSDEQLVTLVKTHCTMCHSAKPTHAGFNEAPKGLILEDIAVIKQNGALILAQAVQSDVMPLGNETGFTQKDREALGAWIHANQ